MYLIGLNDPCYLGILSSAVHIRWMLAAGSTLEDRPLWINSTCFLPFPFPEIVNSHIGRVRAFAEQLDSHRKRQQASHLDLTLTGMYNALEKLRSDEPLTAKDRTIHEHGLVSVLRQLHDELDAAVLDAYGWSDLLPLLRVAHANDAPTRGQTREDAARAFDETILERLVTLNTERAAEEARGLIRWLRPEFQNLGAQPAPVQAEMETGAGDTEEAGEPAAVVAGKLTPKAWPRDPLDQVRAVADVLTSSPGALTVDDVAGRFTSRGPWKKRLGPLLDMLVTLGRAREKGGLYRARG